MQTRQPVLRRLDIREEGRSVDKKNEIMETLCGDYNRFHYVK